MSLYCFVFGLAGAKVTSVEVYCADDADARREATLLVSKAMRAFPEQFFQKKTWSLTATLDGRECFTFQCQLSNQVVLAA